MIGKLDQNKLVLGIKFDYSAVRQEKLDKKINCTNKSHTEDGIRKLARCDKLWRKKSSKARGESPAKGGGRLDTTLVGQSQERKHHLMRGEKRERQ